MPADPDPPEPGFDKPALADRRAQSRVEPYGERPARACPNVEHPTVAPITDNRRRRASTAAELPLAVEPLYDLQTTRECEWSATASLAARRVGNTIGSRRSG